MEDTSSELRGLKWINLFAYTLNVLVTYGIGVAGLFGMPTNAELSAKYQTIVTPVGWAFAIWGIIFMAQGLWVAQQFYWRLSERYVEAIVAVKYNYLFVVLAQASWTLTFSNELIAVSTVMMALILWNLSVIVLSLSRLGKDEPRSMLAAFASYFLLEFPFAVHFGWILAATVVNVNVFLVSQHLNASIQFFSAVGGLLFLVISALAMIAKGSLTTPVVVTWALLGVCIELQSPKASITSVFSIKQLEIVQYGALGAMILLLVATGVAGVRHYMRPTPLSEESVYLRANE